MNANTDLKKTSGNLRVFFRFFLELTPSELASSCKILLIGLKKLTCFSQHGQNKECICVLIEISPGNNLVETYLELQNQSMIFFPCYFFFKICACIVEDLFWFCLSRAEVSQIKHHHCQWICDLWVFREFSSEVLRMSLPQGKTTYFSYRNNWTKIVWQFHKRLKTKHKITIWPNNSSSWHIP